ncbi:MULTISPECIES: tRNA (adenosine(37)-N6)-dimethylallyltransferase MiaA [Exiguobacterium]|uniref:tRNA dimethylallyltransferase n=1 Tax=Exiguobacterium sp. (strain ATCC BAA-1283 / AT1b) TaxID=360911 RepID=MIAA_EXISA|nr:MULTISPECIES: tRNA (adenosine(37)-N6)-dimethylallyltransferase MiaA [unclassified Exiguobacterium]C4L1B9.1 RecName: Full=tRNA dimethylallyltransferase; AltName: Full=Dimethylallyl diphosphate:tRNA dimethylallyltransferase; Short=DMAPP:tRNA dimethylallyltransferase; Short=DMATase; AltName: Full=Isopentenyl-diphosphate:tRNA isopentenyltransferase; Short=IPP transferase; Short=IPPT; Short=IPTase [Exiguobacterium sp. AT1b]ACQ69065.1 tRNA delta(2)-isopentenylpyrophosphate transferase [Exiguobacteri
MKKTPVVVIVGPTAVGKTKTGIELAKAFDGEIVSGDSVQVYRGMDIGSAKVTKEEAEGIPHHLIDICDPDDAMSVAMFQQLARAAIDDIYARGKLPIIVGGTGLYIRSILYDYEFVERPVDEALREELERLAEVEGREALHQRLVQLDPERAATIHPNNVRRVVRALEVAMQGDTQTTDSAPSEHYDYRLFVLHADREILYDRINQRVDAMMEAGLVEEVERLLAQGYRDTQAMRAIGYKEIIPYVEGKISKDRATDLLKQHTRQFAKRQLTWFRHQFDGIWVDMGRKSFELSYKNIYDDVEGFFRKFRLF